MRVGLEAFPFHLHPEKLGLLVAAIIGFVYAVTRLARRRGMAPRDAVSRRDIVWFTSGLILYALVELWPFHDIAEGSLFSFHMIEHLVLALLVVPCILNGIPAWLMAVIVRPLLPIMRILTKPLVGLIAFNAVLALFHAPSIVRLQLNNELAHLGLHATLIATAFLMWWPVLGRVPGLVHLSPPAAMGYLFLQSLVPTIPASFLTFASAPVYSVYSSLPRLWGFDVLSDQLVAGLIMKVGGGLILWVTITVIFFRWSAASQVDQRPKVPLPQ